MLCADPRRRRFGAGRGTRSRNELRAFTRPSATSGSPSVGGTRPVGAVWLGGGSQRAAPQPRPLRAAQRLGDAPLFWEVALNERAVPNPTRPPPSRQHGAALRGPTGPTRGIFNPGFGFACRGRRESGGAVRALAGSCVTFKGPRDEFHGSPRLSGSPPVRLSAGRGFLFRVSVSSDPLPKPSGSALHAAAPLAVPPPQPAPLRIPARLHAGNGSVLHPRSRLPFLVRFSAFSRSRRGSGIRPPAFLPPSLSAALLTQRFGECPLRLLAAR